MNHQCEITQMAISDKFDHSEELSPEERQHRDSCAECMEFSHFIHSKVFTEIARTPAIQAQAPERGQVDAIMDRLSSGEHHHKPHREKVLSVWLGLAAVAAVIAISMSGILSFTEEESGITESADSFQQPEMHVSLVNLTLPEIDLDKKYSAINEVVADRIESFSNGVQVLVNYMDEGNEFLNEHTEVEPENIPESNYYDINNHTSDVS